MKTTEIYTEEVSETIIVKVHDDQNVITLNVEVPVSLIEANWNMKIKKVRDGWQLTKDNVSFISPTPLFYHVGLKDFEGKWERHFKIAEGDTCLDVGACIGDTTVPMAIKSKGGQIIAIEPDPANIVYLKRNLEGQNATIIEKAVSHEKGHFALHQHNVLTGHSLVPSAERHSSIMVETDTLDSMLNGLHVDFAKIDVMGSEATILAGARGFLGSVRKLAIKTYQSHEQVMFILKQHGFSSVVFAEDVGVVYANRD